MFATSWAGRRAAACQGRATRRRRARCRRASSAAARAGRTVGCARNVASPAAAASASAGAAWTKYCGRSRAPLIAIETTAATSHASTTKRPRRAPEAAISDEQRADAAEEPEQIACARVERHHERDTQRRSAAPAYVSPE